MINWFWLTKQQIDVIRENEKIRKLLIESFKKEKEQLKTELEQEKALRKSAEDALSEKEALVNQKSELASNAYSIANDSISSIENSFNQSIDSLKVTIEENIQESYSSVSGIITALDNVIKQFEDVAETNKQNCQTKYDEAISRNDYATAGQFSGLMAGYGDAASKFSYIRSELIQKLLRVQVSSYQNNLLSSNGYVFSNTKSQILNAINDGKTNLNRLYLSSQNTDNNNNNNEPDILDHEMMQEVQDILSYPWRFIDVWKNSNENWYSQVHAFNSVGISVAIFEEEFGNSDNSINVTYNKQLKVKYHLFDSISAPEITEDLSVIHTSKMLNQGNMYAVIRTVKNGGMGPGAEKAVIPPNNTVISFYRREGQNNGGREYLTYWDRIFLDTNGANEIYLVISGLQVGESVPYNYRQMPSQWDKFVSNNPGGVKINIKRETENQFHIYYCENDNADINLGTLFKFSLDRDNKEIINCIDCHDQILTTVTWGTTPLFVTPNNLDPNS